MKKNIFSAAIILMFAIAALNQGCKKDKEEDPGIAPQIPPSSTFVMNLTDLDSGKAPGKGGKDSTYTNFLYSAGNVFVWNVILTVGLAVPVASFVNSFNYPATWNSQNNAWEWTYPFVVGNDQYTALLKATVSGSQVHWNMYISKQGGFQSFLWYSGDSKLDGSQGTWTLNDNPLSNKPLLGILWHRNVSAGTSDITYTNIVPGGPENGGYISYGIVSDTVYNAFYDIFNKGKNNHTNIKWHRIKKNGRVQDSLHFGNYNWHCWDVDYTDVTCP